MKSHVPNLAKPFKVACVSLVAQDVRLFVQSVTLWLQIITVLIYLHACSHTPHGLKQKYTQSHINKHTNTHMKTHRHKTSSDISAFSLKPHTAPPVRNDIL